MRCWWKIAFQKTQLSLPLLDHIKTQQYLRKLWQKSILYGAYAAQALPRWCILSSTLRCVRCAWGVATVYVNLNYWSHSFCKSGAWSEKIEPWWVVQWCNHQRVFINVDCTINGPIFEWPNFVACQVHVPLYISRTNLMYTKTFNRFATCFTSNVSSLAYAAYCATGFDSAMKIAKHTVRAYKRMIPHELVIWYVCSSASKNNIYECYLML